MSLRLVDLKKDAVRWNLEVTQLPYPPGGYAVRLLTLTVTIKERSGTSITRSPEIWCRNLEEAAYVLEHRPKFSKRYR